MGGLAGFLTRVVLPLAGAVALVCVVAVIASVSWQVVQRATQRSECPAPAPTELVCLTPDKAKVCLESIGTTVPRGNK